MANREVTARYVGVALPETVELSPGDEKKSPSVFCKLRITEGPEAGRDLPWRGYLKEGKAQEITFNQLRAMGWQDNDITKLTGLGSTKVDIVETMDEWEGKVRPQYGVWPFKGERPTVREEDRAQFAKRFKALAASVKPIAVTPANAAPEQLPEARAYNGAGHDQQLPGSPL